MGVDSAADREHQQLREYIEAEKHTLPERVRRFGDIKALREQQKREAAAKRREARRARRAGEAPSKPEPPSPDGDPTRDITDKVARMVGGAQNRR